jgi:hypothetical protein
MWQRMWQRIWTGAARVLLGSRGKTKKNFRKILEKFLFVFPFHLLDKTDKNKKSVKNEQKLNKIFFLKKRTQIREHRTKNRKNRSRGKE